MKLLIHTVFIILLLSACSIQKSNKDTKKHFVLAKIDSVSIAQIKQGENRLKGKSIFAYYKTERAEAFDEFYIWSEKMFGRCCTEADLSYAELLEFDISTNNSNSNPLYPDSNLSDNQYSTTYVLKQGVAIYIKLNKKDESSKYFTGFSVDEVLKENDTLMKPFRLSLVNGYTKSKTLFEQNGRAKTLKVFLNNKYTGTVRLQDIPLVQYFELDILFKRDDTIKLVPLDYYKGTKYDNFCISEIQSSLGYIAHPSINKKYKVQELWKKSQKTK